MKKRAPIRKRRLMMKAPRTLATLMGPMREEVGRSSPILAAGRDLVMK